MGRGRKPKHDRGRNFIHADDDDDDRYEAGHLDQVSSAIQNLDDNEQVDNDDDDDDEKESTDATLDFPSKFSLYQQSVQVRFGYNDSVN